MAYEPELVKFVEKCETEFVDRLVAHFENKSEEEKHEFLETMSLMGEMIQSGELK